MSKASCEKDVVVGRRIKKYVCISKESLIYMPYYGFPGWSAATKMV